MIKRSGLWSVLIFLASCYSLYGAANTSELKLPRKIERPWISPEIWSNPIQDWRLKAGRMECFTSGGGRNLFWLTRELESGSGGFRMEVESGKIDPAAKLDEGWIGFLIGVRGDFNDYRDNAVRGEGFPVGITTGGILFIGSVKSEGMSIDALQGKFRLVLQGDPVPGGIRLKLYLYNNAGKAKHSVESTVDADWVNGGISLSCSTGAPKKTGNDRSVVQYGNWGFKPGTARGGNVCFWFSNWSCQGDMVKTFPERAWGPILFTQYTLSGNLLKLTAQMAPLGRKDNPLASLEVKDGLIWKKIAEKKIDSLSRTVTFRATDWPSQKEVPYRVIYTGIGSENRKQVFSYEGIIRKEPLTTEAVSLAAFTGNNDLGFPNTDIVKSVLAEDPDLLFFSGDQIYEGVGGYGIEIAPLERACLDYLRKWYLFGWEYGDLLKSRPSVSIPDDHDVYHGNIWGAGGIATPRGLSGSAAQDKGGYKMDPIWVNMVQTTQTSHLPDPVDPEPVAQGIGVYFTDMKYGGVSFAIIEDRKFKSAPAPLLPEAKIVNGFATTRGYKASEQADIPEASLLGDRQERFLDSWIVDWTQGVWMKVVLSQTIFANVATLPAEEAYSDEVVPKLRIMQQGEYPENDTTVQDFDSNGWPQAARNRVLKTLRKGYALHIAGDQHLASVIQYGVQEHRDAGFAFCVPAVSNVWPRRWCPKEQGFGRFELDPRYTGDYLDGFGNRMTVRAVANPVYTGRTPSLLYDRATGFGIVRFYRESRDITMECWPRESSKVNAYAVQYPGWPLTINQLDNRSRQSRWVLPLIKVPEIKNSVIQVVSEKSGEVVISMRIKGHAFQPPVDGPGKYTIWVGEPESGPWIGIPGFEAVPSHVTREYVVRFN